MSRVSENLYDGAIADLSITFTTDDPAITPDSAITIADGDNISAANTVAAIVEIVTKVNTILGALRTVGVLKGTGAAGATVAAVSAPTAITVAYTTDAPAITPNSTITIADGDAATVTRAEYNELAEEFEAAFNSLRSKLILAGVFTA
jgi:hypothetical protein